MLRASATAVLLAAVVAGCGSDEGDPEEQAVRDTVERFYASAAEGDGKDACELADRAFRETVGDGCPEGLTDIYEGQAPAVEGVEVDRDTATVRVSDPPPDDVIQLVKEADGWRVLLSGE